MAQTIIITVNTIGPGTGPFNIYSLDNLGVVTGPFETGVTRAQLLAGFVSINVPNDAVTIRVVSLGTDCPLSLDIFLNIITTTTTTTLEPITTSTTTSTTTLEPTTTTTTTTSTSTTTSTTTAPGVPILLGYGGTSGTFACITAGEAFLLNPTTYYLASGCISLTITPPCDTLYIDPYLTSVVVDGTYSDGVNCYDIKGGIVSAVIPLITTTTTVPGGRPGGFIMYDCTGRSYEVFSNCQEVGLGCYLYEDIYNTPVVPGIYMLTYDPDYGGFQTNLSGLIINISSCY
jgi:hypothetical protein